MKTFETEKHNIPEGATHYSGSSDERYFSWFMHTGDEWFIQIWSDKDWVKCKYNEQDKSGVKPIPQTNIETPEEKEGEWVNGDKCLYMNSSEVHKFIGIDPTRNDFCYIKAGCSSVNWVEIAKLSKPETEVERVEREREDAINEMSLIVESGNGFAGNAYKKYCASLYDAGYRKES